MKKRPGSALHSSWNWELISDKPLDWWLPRIRRHQAGLSRRILIASIMAGSGNDKELQHWQRSPRDCQDAGRGWARAQLLLPAHGPPGHGLEHRQGPGALLGRHRGGEGGGDGAGLVQAHAGRRRTSSSRRAACFRGGADAIVSSNTFPSLPLIDPDTLEFEINVDGLVSTGGLGGPAILPLSLAKMAQLTQAFPDKSFSGIGGISDFAQALSYFLLGCGTVQVCTAAMLDHAIGPERDQAAAGGARRVSRATCRRRLDRHRGFPRPPARSRRRAVADSAAGQCRLPRRLRGDRRLRGCGGLASHRH